MSFVLDSCQKSRSSCELSLKIENLWEVTHRGMRKFLRNANTSDRIDTFRCEFDNGK